MPPTIATFTAAWATSFPVPGRNSRNSLGRRPVSPTKYAATVNVAAGGGGSLAGVVPVSDGVPDGAGSPLAGVTVSLSSTRVTPSVTTTAVSAPTMPQSQDRLLPMSVPSLDRDLLGVFHLAGALPGN